MKIKCPKCKSETNHDITIGPDNTQYTCLKCGCTVPLKDTIIEPPLNIKYYPGISNEKLVDTITLKDNDYFTVGDLKEALKYFDDDTAVYVSNSIGGNLCRMISHEPDGTITLSNDWNDDS